MCAVAAFEAPSVALVPDQGSVVQSIVSLKESVVEDSLSLTKLTKSNVVLVFAN